MKKNILLLLLGVFLSNLSFSQLALRIEQEGVKAGYIIKNGVKIEGYLKIMDFVYINRTPYPAPWNFQKRILFIKKNTFETLPAITPKNYKEYTPKDIEGYRYDVFDYRTVKYSDQSSLDFDIIPKLMFLRVIDDRKITLFQYFNTPLETTNESLSKVYSNCAIPQWVFQNGAKAKVKLLRDMNVKNELADCPNIVQRYKNGEFNVVGNNRKGGVAKLANNDFKVEVRLNTVDAYNTECE